MEKIIVAKAIVKALEAEGVKVVFGYPGGAILPLYNELRNSGIKHVLVRHEQGAAHMADGYARSTGKVGICLTTSGPGATNLTTGIATAYMDSSPVLVITGQVVTPLIGTDAFQETDITGITIPITKHNELVTRSAEVPKLLKETFYLCRTGRKGPVLLDFPVDVLKDEIDFGHPPSVKIEGYEPISSLDHSLLEKSIKLIKNSKRPLIIAGGGVITANASTQVFELIEMLEIPIVTTLMGKGSFPETHPLCMNLMGIHGTKYGNFAVQHADCILAIGTRFSNRSTGSLDTFAREAKVIHIDIDPSEIDKNVETEVGIVGDAKDILSKMINLFKQSGFSHPDEWRKWNKTITKIKGRNLLTPKPGMRVPYIVNELYKNYPNCIIVTDVGRHQMWSAHFYNVLEPRKFITPGGLGTMGFGIPAAIGAQVGNPDKKVVCIVGDGGFMMTCQEIATAVAYKVPIVVLVMNDSRLGMVWQLQDVFYNKRHFAVNFKKEINFAKFATSLGAAGIRVEQKEKISEALDRAFNSNGPVIVDFIVKKDERVYPMVVGKSLEEMIE